MFSKAVYVSSLTCNKFHRGQQRDDKSEKATVKTGKQKSRNYKKRWGILSLPLLLWGQSFQRQILEAQFSAASFDILGQERVLVHTASIRPRKQPRKWTKPNNNVNTNSKVNTNLNLTNSMPRRIFIYWQSTCNFWIGINLHWKRHHGNMPNLRVWWGTSHHKSQQCFVSWTPNRQNQRTTLSCGTNNFPIFIISILKYTNKHNNGG